MDDISKSNSVPLYEQIVQVIRKRIADGTYAYDTRIPSETELSKEFDVSRITVRNSINKLVEEHLLVKKQGKGTFVINKKIERNIEEFMGFSDICQLKNMIPSARVISVKMINPDDIDTDVLNASPDQKIIEVIRVRYADDEPVIIEYLHFTQEFLFLLKENLEESLYGILRERGIVPQKATKIIELCYASPNEAELLGIKNKSALILMEDYVYDGNSRPIHRCRQLIRGDRFKFVIPVT
ncbi:GntR family transcriptional regulator [Sediminispirochaeta bajacaliforniensis]|uniref:GntR family transcriptional regulator n=1 Tax=Sediminispirochaeta bajacaliforniensis TaxID=148 RepID=UPI000378C8E2|nr:GntR family transcriptional regulator [Sediminispirochaeta bajacaliforniensis]